MTQCKNIKEVAKHFRKVFKVKNDTQAIKTILLFAYNGTGKTRLSMEFKELGKEVSDRDTLYFNAFTEDLFTWYNDLNGDSQRKLLLNKDSQFFKGLEELEMDTRIRKFLSPYYDYDFEIDYKNWEVTFSRKLKNPDYDENSGNTEQERELIEDNIKVSRGEENIFVWCFFLAVLELAMDKEIEAYSWVKYVYIDDPISSLDENNAVAVAHRLAKLLKKDDNPLKAIISSHHTLFFNVMCNEYKNQMAKKM